MKKVVAHSHCHACGQGYEVKTVMTSSWPRTCQWCDTVSYRNPLPVGVLLIPTYDGGLLLIRRAHAPARGKLAMPGGFIEYGETWQEGTAREGREELGITDLHGKYVSHFLTESAPSGNIIIFGIYSVPLSKEQLSSLTLSPEVEEIVITYPGDSRRDEIEFSTHAAAAHRFFMDGHIVRTGEGT